MKRKDIRTYVIIMIILYIPTQLLDTPLNEWIYILLILMSFIILVIELYKKHSGEIHKWWRKKK